MKKFKEFTKYTRIQESIQYHIDNKIPIFENSFRPYSDNFFEFYREIKKLYDQNKIVISEDFEYDFLNSDIGEFAVYDGKNVPLDIPLLEEDEKVEIGKPKRGGPKKFYVYVKNDKGNVQKVAFGAKEGGGNLAVKINDPDARKAFAARHNCAQANDKTTPKYWACRLPRYAKALGLKVNNPSAWW